MRDGMRASVSKLKILLICVLVSTVSILGVFWMAGSLRPNVIKTIDSYYNLHIFTEWMMQEAADSYASGEYGDEAYFLGLMDKIILVF